MKRLLIIPLILIVLPGRSQDSEPGEPTDEKIPVYSSMVCSSLSHQLTASSNTDLEKVSAIFNWITQNIDYRTRSSRASKKNSPDFYDATSDTGALKPLDERVAEAVLENRLAVCDGYARLFKTLCYYAGIRSEVISGYARTDPRKIIQRFRPNHSWNAVMIDSAWKLLDVTWASGYTSLRDDYFIRQYDPQYFLTSPDQFIREHYPDEIRWTLMSDPPLMAEFKLTPFKQRSFSKYKISSYRPEKGIIESKLGDTLQLELESSDTYADQRVSADPFLDTSLYSTKNSVLLVPATFIGNKYIYRYIADTPSIQWIYILYNGDLIMRYRLLFRKEEPVIATIPR